MEITLAQLPSREGCVADNLAQALAFIERYGQMSGVILFPETHLTGFAAAQGDTDYALQRDGDELAQLVQASRQYDVALVTGFLERTPEGVFNSTVLITPEQGIYLHYRKTHLWPDERTSVLPGDALVCGDWRGTRIGLLICYDLEFPENARALAMMGCQLLLITNGNMDPYGPVHRHAAIARAQDNQIFVAMTNRCGEGDGLQFAGESLIVDPLGRDVAGLGRDAGALSVELDFTLLEQARRHYRYLDDRRWRLSGEALWTEDKAGRCRWPLSK
ncbi:carbon-nitrogen hydrolase family protein [Serratia grimesii]|uniref:carbon-nitrogen hydrolase family protein n=1 Tax=Serratia grimesii TaxID=82995 RepID=UPI00077C8B8F|nr:carbon-nitrogen hydrolase family protein [Serratia grimesii]CAI0720139.1 (R)-stereoselective amidase [Serratia grimesii]CAI2442753.1 (R)-stereoselective amidase [Serratia grimesii]SUI32748.1 (R)-stereoselective amidase [Serratia grimesii]